MNIDQTLIIANRLHPKEQLDIIVEELSELITAIQHYKRDKSTRFDILNERSDVKIMLRQLDIMFGFTEFEIENVMQEKILKLQIKLTKELQE